MPFLEERAQETKDHLQHCTVTPKQTKTKWFILQNVHIVEK